jgi:uncharacterized protein YacL
VIVFGWAGLLAGLAAGALLYPSLSGVSGRLGWLLPLGISAAFGLAGAVLGVWRHEELAHVMDPKTQVSFSTNGMGRAETKAETERIVVDTSAIIDGRIADLAGSGFLIGKLYVPGFVLDELRRIADASDPLRRNRGRRGLDVLGRLNKESLMPVEIIDAPLDNGTDVDGRLVKLAKQWEARLLTTDFNLDRAAGLNGVRVLNVNALANALRQVILPGEEIPIRVTQEGREFGQGVGFLDDGTMVVVDGGKRFVNSEIEVVVSRVLQTATGRIIFAQPKASVHA